MGVYSSTMRYTGLSGIDTESMVQALMKAESYKYDNLKKTRQKTAWKQEAYKTQVNAIQSFYKSFLDLAGANSLRSSTSFFKTTATVSAGNNASKAATVRTSSTTSTGTYKLSIESLATKDTYIGGKVTGEGISGTEAFNVNNLNAGESIKVTLDGRTVEIKLDELDGLDKWGTETDGWTDDKNADFVTALNKKLKKEFGVDSSGKQNVEADLASVSGVPGKVLSFKASDIGSHTLKITEGTTNASADKTTVTASTKLTDALASATADADGKYSFKVGAKTIKFAAGANDDETITNIRSALSKAGVNNVGVTMDDGKLKFSAVGTTENLEISGLAELGFDSDSKVFEPTSVLARMGGLKNGASNTVNTDKSIKDVFGADVGSQVVLNINGSEIKVDSSKSIKDLMNAVNNSGAKVTMSYDSIKETFKIESTSTGAVNTIDLTEELAKGDNSFLKKLGIGGTGSSYKAASDAEFTLNDEKFVRSSNDVTVGGLSLTLNETTKADEDLTIEVSKNTEATFDLIKSFVEGYNNLISSINGAVNETRAKTGTYNYYEPLTDDQKSEMKDSEIQVWEAKAKQGVLYRDQTLSSITSAMRSALYESVTLDDGRKISLYEIGITTSPNVSDQGKLIIDEDKLREALESRGEDVAALFYQPNTGLADRLNTIVNKAVGTNGSLTKKAGNDSHIASQYDNELYKQLQRQDEQLAQLLVSLRKKENNYYSKFSKMESSVSQYNSQLSYLQSM